MRVWPLALVAVGLVFGAACNEVQSYVFSARKYDPDAGCLDPYTSIDQISGRGAGNKCGPTCFRFNGAIYSTRVCPPLPESVDELDQKSPECIAANEPAIYDASCAKATGNDDDAGEDAAVLDASTEGG